MNNLIATGKQCPYCSSPTVFVDSAEVYSGTSYGMIYLCRPCKAWVGVHKETNVALGRLADSDLRRFKKMAHARFDAIWKMKKNLGVPHEMARQGSYEQLAKYMGLPREQTHLGLFDIDQCKQVIELCETQNWLTKEDYQIINNKMLTS